MLLSLSSFSLYLLFAATASGKIAQIRFNLRDALRNMRCKFAATFCRKPRNTFISIEYDCKPVNSGLYLPGKCSVSIHLPSGQGGRMMVLCNDNRQGGGITSIVPFRNTCGGFTLFSMTSTAVEGFLISVTSILFQCAVSEQWGKPAEVVKTEITTLFSASGY